MINFSELPKESPNMIPEADVYKARIVEATMKAPKDMTKPAYLNLKYQLTKHDGTSAGTMFDMLFDSDSSTLQYKLGRFLRACNIPLQGAMELSDIAKLVGNKEIVIDTKVTPASGNFSAKAEVDVFSREAYYTAPEFDEIWTLVHKEAQPAPAADEVVAVPENASEADGIPFDATPTNDGNTSVPGTEY